MAGISIGALVAIAAEFVAIAAVFYIILKKKNKWQRNASPASAGEHCLYLEERSRTRGQIIAKLLGSGICHPSVDNEHNLQLT